MLRAMPSSPSPSRLPTGFGYWGGAFDSRPSVYVAGKLEFNDPVLLLKTAESPLECDEGGFCYRQIMWGRLFLDPVCEASAVSEATELCGSLSVNRGVEIIRRVIRFKGNHNFMLPRADRTLTEWISRTTIHNDGIAVDMVITPAVPILDAAEIVTPGPDNDTVYPTVVDPTYPVEDPVKIVFETGPYNSTFTPDEISALDTFTGFNGGENKVPREH